MPTYNKAIKKGKTYSKVMYNGKTYGKVMFQEGSTPPQPPTVLIPPNNVNLLLTNNGSTQYYPYAIYYKFENTENFIKVNYKGVRVSQFPFESYAAIVAESDAGVFTMLLGDAVNLDNDGDGDFTDRNLYEINQIFDIPSNTKFLHFNWSGQNGVTDLELTFYKQ